MSKYDVLLDAAEHSLDGKITFTEECRKTAIALFTELEKKSVPLPELSSDIHEETLYLEWKHSQSDNLDQQLRIQHDGRCRSWSFSVEEKAGPNVEGWAEYIEERMKPHPFYSLPKATSGIEGYLLLQCGHEGIQEHLGIFSKEEAAKRLKILRETPHNEWAKRESYCVQLVNSEGTKCVCAELEAALEDMWLY